MHGLSYFSCLVSPWLVLGGCILFGRQLEFRGVTIRVNIAFILFFYFNFLMFFFSEFTYSIYCQLFKNVQFNFE